MSVARKSLSSLKLAIEALSSSINSNATNAINAVIESSSTSGFASYNKCLLLYNLINANTTNTTNNTKLNTLIGTTGNSLSALPSGLQSFNAIGLALETIDGIVNLSGANTSYDTLAEIVNYMNSNNTTYLAWIETAVRKNALVRGSSTFNVTASTGVTSVVFATARSSASYQVFIMPSADPSASIGEWFVSGKTTEGFTVTASGNATSAFDYLVLDDFAIAGIY